MITFLKVIQHSGAYRDLVASCGFAQVSTSPPLKDFKEGGLE